MYTSRSHSGQLFVDLGEQKNDNVPIREQDWMKLMDDSVDRVASDNGAVKSADRVLDLFELLAQWGREMSHTEISQALSIPKGSLSKLLKNLVTRHYLEYVPASKGYKLGEAVRRLAETTQTQLDLLMLAKPLLKEITEATLESCALSYLRGDQVEVVATEISPQRLLSHLRLGDLAPLYAVSAGKIILAFLPQEQRDVYLANVTFKAYTDATISSTEQLMVQISEAEGTGISFSIEEFTPGIIGIAVAVRSGTGFPIAALNVAMPEVRYTTASRDKAIAALLDAATKLSRHYTGRE